jgi:hypothetical protein
MTTAAGDHAYPALGRIAPRYSGTGLRAPAP